MTRRALVLAAALAVSRKDRHNRMCERAGALRERHGLTERERADLLRRGCKFENGVWMSGRVYPADEG